MDQLPVFKSEDVHDALRSIYLVIQVVHQAIHRGKHFLADGQNDTFVQSVSVFEEFDPDGLAVLFTVQKAWWVALIALVAVLIVTILLPDPLLVGFRDGHSVSSTIRGLGVILALTRLVRISLQKITFDVGFKTQLSFIDEIKLQGVGVCCDGFSENLNLASDFVLQICDIR